MRYRAKVEDEYVRGLQRLAAKTYVTDRNSLGYVILLSIYLLILFLLTYFFIFRTFVDVWDTLFNELNEIIQIHTLLISKIYEEVEGPLRENPEWSKLKIVCLTLSYILMFILSINLFKAIY